MQAADRLDKFLQTQENHRSKIAVLKPSIELAKSEG